MTNGTKAHRTPPVASEGGGSIGGGPGGPGNGARAPVGPYGRGGGRWPGWM
ncbi:hypothetical protein ACA511_05890 [Actinomadura sp. GTD37]